MRIAPKYLIGFSILLFCILMVFTDIVFAESLVISLQVYTFLVFINNIGYTISFFEFLCFYSVLDTLLMPLVGYNKFNYQNKLAHIWGSYMRVPDDVYYSFMIPANIALILGTSLMSRENNREYLRKILAKIREIPDKGNIGIVLTILGFIATVFQKMVPAGLSFVVYLLAMLKYVGPLYIFYSDYKYRKIILWVSVVLFFLQAVVAGLFGEFAMYVLLIFVIISVEMKLKFFGKLSFLLTAIFLVMVIQSVKLTYREITWGGKTIKGLSVAGSSNAEVFASLFVDRLQNVETIFEEPVLFMIYVRINQGFLVSRVMNYVPRVEPYAEGSTIIRSIGAIIVPRFLWPDKPEAGGRDNLRRFVGIKKRLDYSMNIGPYGEAYGNFGPVYGTLFVFIYGALLASLLKFVLKKAIITPSLLLWLPLLFYYTLTVETDILTTLNSFLKGLLFVALCYFISKRIFRTAL
jgi:hypothetical protein